MSKAISARIRALGFDQSSFARHCHLDVGTVSRWCRGVQRPPTVVYALLAQMEAAGVQGKRRGRPVIVDGVVFSTCGVAASAFEISRSLAQWRARYGKNGWRYLDAPIPKARKEKAQ